MTNRQLVTRFVGIGLVEWFILATMFLTTVEPGESIGIADVVMWGLVVFSVVHPVWQVCFARNRADVPRDFSLALAKAFCAIYFGLLAVVWIGLTMLGLFGLPWTHYAVLAASVPLGLLFIMVITIAIVFLIRERSRANWLALGLALLPLVFTLVALFS